MPKFDPSLLPDAPDLSFEVPLWEAGVKIIAGVDEAGRGPLAGPVTAAAVILPPEVGVATQLVGVRDSKQMTARQRESAADKIRNVALAWGVGLASAAEIDALGIVPATRLAAERALASLTLQPETLLLDCLFLPELSLTQISLIKGDSRALSIAAASVLAKTTRDALMRSYDVLYPGYGFGTHKGYGTAAHRCAIERLGPCPIHRKSFHVKVIVQDNR